MFLLYKIMSPLKNFFFFAEKTPTPEEIEAQQMLEWERHQSQAGKHL